MLMFDNYHIWRLLSSCRPTHEADIYRLLQIVDEWRDSGYLWLRAQVKPMPHLNPPSMWIGASRHILSVNIPLIKSNTKYTTYEIISNQKLYET